MISRTSAKQLDTKYTIIQQVSCTIIPQCLPIHGRTNNHRGT